MLYKELREHALSLLLLLLLVALVDALVLLLVARIDFTVSRLDAIRLVHAYAMPLVLLVLGNRLVVHDYATGTALWLDSLPIRRSTPVLVKYTLGLLAASVASLLASTPVIVLSWQSDLLDPGFAAILLARTLGWTALAWSVVFCISHFGSLRYVLYLLVIGALLLVSNAPAFDATRLAPFALLSATRFAYDRAAIPGWALGQAIGLSLVLLLIVLLLASGRRRALVERLAQPVGRSGWFMLASLLLVMLLVGNLLQRDDEPVLVAVPGEHLLVYHDPDVAVHIGDGIHRALGEARLQHLVAWLPRLRDALALSVLPAVELVFDEQLDAGEIRLAGRGGAGVVIDPFSLDDDRVLLADVAIVHEILTRVNQGRGDFEPYHWLLDGAAWWLQQRLAAMPPDRHRDALIERARLAAVRIDRLPDLAADWQVLADRHGYADVGALAWSLVVFLESIHGDEALHRLLQAMQLTPVPDDLRAVIAYRRQPFATQFEAIVGANWQDTLASWWTWLAAQPVAPWVDAFPPVEVTLAFGEEALSGEHLRATLDWQGVLPMEVTDLQCRLGYSIVGPFDYETYWPDRRSEPQACGDANTQAALTLAGPFRPGSRLYVTLEAESGRFAQPLRLYTTRLVVPR